MEERYNNMTHNHRNIERPYWVVKTKDISVLKYGELKKNTILSTKMDIHTFSSKKEWIYFIEKNGGHYSELEEFNIITEI
jgi:hypothetical protein